MADLKTNYQDDVLDTTVNSKRTFNIVDQDGNIIYENVSFDDTTTYSQEGDSFGAKDINETNSNINSLLKSLSDYYPKTQVDTLLNTRLPIKGTWQETIDQHMDDGVYAMNGASALGTFPIDGLKYGTMLVINRYSTNSIQILTGGTDMAIRNWNTTSGGTWYVVSNKDGLPIGNGGTGATTAANARTNLGLGGAAVKDWTNAITSGSTHLVTSGAVYAELNNLFATEAGNITINSTNVGAITQANVMSIGKKVYWISARFSVPGNMMDMSGITIPSGATTILGYCSINPKITMPLSVVGTGHTFYGTASIDSDGNIKVHVPSGVEYKGSYIYVSGMFFTS